MRVAALPLLVRPQTCHPLVNITYRWYLLGNATATPQEISEYYLLRDFRDLVLLPLLPSLALATA